jgi:hypothetical protein
MASLALKSLFIVYLFGSLAVRDWRSYKQFGAGAPHPPLYGLYTVEEFNLDGIDHPALATDSARWRYVMVEEAGKLAVRHMDESLANYGLEYNAGMQELLVASQDANVLSKFKVTDLGNGEMRWEGTWAGKPIDVQMKRVDRDSFTLVSRGFHWISETSFVR